MLEPTYDWYSDFLEDLESHNAPKNGAKKPLSISQERVNEIGMMIEKNVARAFDKAEQSGRPVIDGDPRVTGDNRDDLEEEVLDKLFGGGNNPRKNDIGAENAWNLYGDMVDCSKEEFKAFYEYVKENGF